MYVIIQKVAVQGEKNQPWWPASSQVSGTKSTLLLNEVDLVPLACEDGWPEMVNKIVGNTLCQIYNLIIYYVTLS